MNGSRTADGPPLPVRVDELAERRIQQAAEQYPRLLNVWEALKWNLARDPNGKGVPVDNPGGGWLVAKAYSWAPGGKPIITVLYRVEGNEVHIASSRVEWAKPKKRR